MKNIKFLTAVLFSSLLFTACTEEPHPVNEHEVITTMTITLQPDGGGDDIILKTYDSDGDGEEEPAVTVSGNLAANKTYNGSIELLNETEDPAEDVTEEIEEEDKDHQFFYTVGSGLNVTTEYSNNDSDGNPLGTKFKLTTGEASSGALTFTLRHEPNKPNDGSLDDAGGETDIETTFDVTIE